MSRRAGFVLLIGTLLAAGPAAAAGTAAPAAPAPASLAQARALVSQRHYARALAIYRALLKKTPDDANLLIETARVYGWNDQNGRSAALYERVLKVAPDRRADVLPSLPWQLLWAKQPHRAVHYFREYLAQHPGDIKARLGYAQALAAAGDSAAALKAYRKVLASEPNNARARLGVARALVRAHDYAPALAQYRTLLAAKPDDADLLIEAARVYGWDNRNADSARLYERVIRVAPARRADVLLPLAWQLLWSRQAQAAVPYFEEYVRAHPKDAKARLGLAEALMYSGHWRRAQVQYARVLRSSPQNWRAQLGIARALVKRKDYPAALEVYRKVLLARPRDANLLIEVARVYGWNNENRRSAQLYRRVLEVAPYRRRDVERPLAFQLLWSGQGAQALPYFRAVLARNPGDLKARLGYAQALAASGKDGPAVVEFRRVLAAEPANRAARLDAARALVAEHRYRAALADYDRLLKARPDDANLLIETARVYGWDNRNARAAALYERVLQVAPQRRPVVILPLAWQLTWAGRPERAVPLFREYLRGHPNDVAARVGLADALADAGRLHAALREYRAALKRRPDDLDAAYGEARVLGWMGRYRSAEAVYRGILRRDPNAFGAQAGLEQVRNWNGAHRSAAREMAVLLRKHPQDAGLRHDLATAQYWSGFGDLALGTLDGSRRPADVALRRHIRRDLAPTVSASLFGSTDSDRLHIVGVTLNANYHFDAARWLGLSYRVAHLQQHNAAIPADNVLYGREVLVSGGQRLGGLHSPVGTLWPSVALGVRKYSDWQTFAWRANAKWIPADRWRVDLYSGNEVIENIRSIQNQVTFHSADADVSWQVLPRINLGVGGGGGVFDDRFGDHNSRWRVRSHLLGVLYLHPRIFAEWNFLYFNDSNPNVQVGYYNPGAYWENRLTVGASYRWRGWELAGRGGGGRLTEDPGGTSDWMYFWQASVGRDFGRAGELRLVAGRTDSKQFASTTGAGYSRTYLSLGYIYRF